MTEGLWRIFLDERSTQMIHGIASAVATPEELDNLHVTLGFDATNPVNDIPLCTDPLYAVITDVELFGAENNILVLVLESDDLQKEFARIHENGNADFEFLPYRPHITILKDATEAEFEWLHSVVHAPSIPRLEVCLVNQRRSTIKPKD